MNDTNSEETRPCVTAFGRTFSHDMMEISGFGSGYETCCRAMVLHGVEFLSKHTGEQPVIGGFKELIGVHTNENELARQLEEAILNAKYTLDGEERTARHDCSGAQVQYSMHHAMYAHKIGWDRYVAEMKKENP